MEICEEDQQIINQSHPRIIELIAQLLRIILELSTRIRELENRMNLNSNNSSIPSSQDPLKKPKPKSQRTSTGKPRGGQRGHKGTTLTPSSNPDEIIEHKPETCSNCGSKIHDLGNEIIEERQEVELPPIDAKYIAHRQIGCICPHCHTKNVGQFPAHITNVIQYGPKLTALVVYLSVFQLIPVKRLTDIFRDIFNCPISPGTVFNMTIRISSNLEEFMENIKNLLINSSVIHTDETGTKIGKKKSWLHVACTKFLTLYGIFQNRGKKGIDALGVLPNYLGIVVHDFWNPYLWYLCLHAYCNAHIIRELTRVEEETGQQWAVKLRSFLVKAKRISESFHEKKLLVPPDSLELLNGEYLNLIQEGFADNPPPIRKKGTRGKIKKTHARNLVERMQAHQTEILRFLHDPKVPFDNNLAERDIRMPKLKMKISGVFRSDTGALAFCRIRSYISTMKKNKVSVIEGLVAANMGQAWSPNQPLTPDVGSTPISGDGQQAYA